MEAKTHSDDCLYVNERNNEIHFNAPITTKSMSILVKNLLILENTIMKKTRKLKRKFSEMDENENNMVTINIEPQPIKLFITSNGGLVHQVFMAIDTITSMKIPVHTICKGMVASAGTLLSLAGKKRFMTEHSYMLIHQVRSGMWGKFAEMKDDYENTKNLMDDIINYYIKKTKMTIEELESQLKQDVSWNAITCLQKGLIDEII